jgi:hypothetical protein
VSAPLCCSLPPCGGGLGWGVAGECSADDLNNALSVLHNVMVPEAEDAKAFAFQERCSGYIRFTFSVLSPIDFDDELGLETREVHDVRTNWGLAPKPMPVDLFATQARPEACFCVGQIAAQFASDGDSHGGILAHSTPLPNPPPQGGREKLVLHTHA